MKNCIVRKVSKIQKYDLWKVIFIKIEKIRFWMRRAFIALEYYVCEKRWWTCSVKHPVYDIYISYQLSVTVLLTRRDGKCGTLDPFSFRLISFFYFSQKYTPPVPPPLTATDIRRCNRSQRTFTVTIVLRASHHCFCLPKTRL